MQRLIRQYPDATRVTVPEDAIVQEDLILARWQEAMAPLADTPSDPIREHDHLLGQIERLGALHREDPTHLGILRDLLTAEADLLGFETGDLWAATLRLEIARHATDLEYAEAPLDDADRLIIGQARSLVLQDAGLYPCVVDMLGTCGDQVVLAARLHSLGQDRFIEERPVSVAGRAMRTLRTLSSCPYADLLWGELYLISAQTPARPETTVALVLRRRGSPANERFYLTEDDLSGSHLISAFGHHRPSDADLTQAILQRWAEPTHTVTP